MTRMANNRTLSDLAVPIGHGKGVILTRKMDLIDWLDPSPEDFEIEWCAKTLSKIARWLGNNRGDYAMSVAQHSVYVSLACPDNPLYGLLHDVHEATFGDWPSPIKAALPELRTIEERHRKAAAEAFGISVRVPEEVERADAAMLQSEWENIVVDYTGHIRPWAPMQAESAFIERYRELTKKGGLAREVRRVSEVKDQDQQADGVVCRSRI